MNIRQPLSSMKIGDIAYIQSLRHADADTKADHSVLLTKRLRHAGFVVGESIEVMWRGWGRHPSMVVRVGGHTHFALRHEEASLVLVSAQRSMHGSQQQVAA